MSGQTQGYQMSGVQGYGAPQFQPAYAGQNGFQAYNGYMPTMGYPGSSQGYQPMPLPTFAPTFNFGGYPQSVGGSPQAFPATGGFGAPPAASTTGMQNMGGGSVPTGAPVNGSTPGSGVFPQMTSPLIAPRPMDTSGTLGSAFLNPLARNGGSGGFTPVSDPAANYQAWLAAGKPTTDAQGRPLDVRGQPITFGFGNVVHTGY